MLFVDSEIYQYTSMTLATTFLVPQIIHTYRTQSAQDISPISIVFIFMSSGLWGCYMYEKELFVYAASTYFVTITSLILAMLKMYTWGTKVREHYNSFGQPPSGAIPVQVQQI